MDPSAADMALAVTLDVFDMSELLRTHMPLWNLPAEADTFGPVPAGTGTITSEIYNIN
jgi:hypothetical protein